MPKGQPAFALCCSLLRDMVHGNSKNRAQLRNLNLDLVLFDYSGSGRTRHEASETGGCGSQVDGLGIKSMHLQANLAVLLQMVHDDSQFIKDDVAAVCRMRPRKHRPQNYMRSRFWCSSLILTIKHTTCGEKRMDLRRCLLYCRVSAEYSHLLKSFVDKHVSFDPAFNLGLGVSLGISKDAINFTLLITSDLSPLLLLYIVHKFAIYVHLSL